MRLGETDEVSFVGSTDRQSYGSQPFEDFSNAAHRIGIPLSHRTAAGFTSETVAWVATPQSPLSLNYFGTTEVSLHLLREEV